MTAIAATATREVTTWRYHLRGTDGLGSGWAIVFMDSIGVFACESDFGAFCHRWPENGWSNPSERDFRQAFLSFDDEYVLRKVARQDHYDSAATCARVKERIIESRRYGSWSKERARTEWDLIGRYENLYSMHDFGQWYERTSIDEAYECAVHTFSPQAMGFKQYVLPRLRGAIKAQLVEER